MYTDTHIHTWHLHYRQSPFEVDGVRIVVISFRNIVKKKDYLVQILDSVKKTLKTRKKLSENFK